MKDGNPETLRGRHPLFRWAEGQTLRLKAIFRLVNLWARTSQQSLKTLGRIMMPDVLCLVLGLAGFVLATFAVRAIDRM